MYTEEPDETKGGSKERVCSVCAYKDEKYIPALFETSVDGLSAYLADATDDTCLVIISDKAPSLSSINTALKASDKKINLDLSLCTDLSSIDSSAFSGCSGLTSVTIPSSVTTIGDSAFEGCSSLTSVTIPSSVTFICEGAFKGCCSLTSVTIPEGVTSIGKSAFKGCSSLTSVTIPEVVTSIGWYAFEGCSSLTSITIPSSVTFIGLYAFSGCSGLTSAVFEKSDGWKAGTDSLSDFDNASTAATYLTDTYYVVTWTRSE